MVQQLTKISVVKVWGKNGKFYKRSILVRKKGDLQKLKFYLDEAIKKSDKLWICFLDEHEGTYFHIVLFSHEDQIENFVVTPPEPKKKPSFICNRRIKEWRRLNDRMLLNELAKILKPVKTERMKADPSIDLTNTFLA